jgi:hypothetical protein
MFIRRNRAVMKNRPIRPTQSQLIVLKSKLVVFVRRVVTKKAIPENPITVVDLF